MAKVVTAEKPAYPPAPKIVEQQPGEKIWQFEKRMQEHQIKKGSRYPAMNIEPMVWERQRLATPMTEEDRFLRRQWVKDQNLSPNEPRFIEASSPKNIFRRTYKAPMDAFQNLVTSMTKNPFYGFMARDTVRKFTYSFLLLFGVYVYAQNKETSWESTRGVLVYGQRVPRLPGDDQSRFPKDPERFGMRYFDKRSSNLDSSKM